jgi:hypothetical protein
VKDHQQKKKKCRGKVETQRGKGTDANKMKRAFILIAPREVQGGDLKCYSTTCGRGAKEKRARKEVYITCINCQNNIKWRL